MADRVVALAVLAASGAYLALSLPLPRGAAARPGAGFFPLVVGVYLCLVAVALVIASSRRAPGAAASTAPRADGQAWARVYATAGGLVGFCVLFPWVGYPLVAFLFVTLLLRRLGGGSWTGALATGLLTAVASYYLFAVLLGVPLPRGPWFD